MRYDREFGYGGRSRRRHGQEWLGRGQYGEDYEAPDDEIRFHGYGMGYGGGGRSRGSFQAGQMRSGLEPRDEFEFEWGDGYVGGRGYGGTNYDLQHGYRTSAGPRGREDEGGRRGAPEGGEFSRSPGRGWEGGFGRAARYDEWEPEGEIGYGEVYGPARYGYGPYHERLKRRRRSDREIRDDVEETLFYDTWVDADRIDIEVEDGVVILRGSLASYDEVRYATDDAWDVDGVRGVRTELIVEERGRATGRPGAREEGRTESARGETGQNEGRTGRGRKARGAGSSDTQEGGNQGKAAGSSRASATSARGRATSSRTGSARTGTGSRSQKRGTGNSGSSSAETTGGGKAERS